MEGPSGCVRPVHQPDEGTGNDVDTLARGPLVPGGRGAEGHCCAEQWGQRVGCGGVSGAGVPGDDAGAVHGDGDVVGGGSGT